MPTGPPKWSSTMVVSGKARARLMASGIWVWAHQTSKLSLRGARCLKPERKSSSQEQALGRVGAVVADVGARMPEGAAPDTAEAPAAGRDLCIEDVGGGIADARVDGADDAGGDAGLAVGAGRAHGGDAVDELGLADAAIVLGAVGPEHGAAFDEYGRDDVVAAVGVGQELVEQIARLHAALAELPEVMMGVADRQVGLEHVLLDLAQPGLVRRMRDHGVSSSNQVFPTAYRLGEANSTCKIGAAPILAARAQLEHHSRRDG